VTPARGGVVVELASGRQLRADRAVICTGAYAGSPGGDGCYWARLDDEQEIIDNELLDGPTILDVRESDAYIQVEQLHLDEVGIAASCRSSVKLITDAAKGLSDT
jgi:hypothetical protein